MTTNPIHAFKITIYNTNHTINKQMYSPPKKKTIETIKQYPMLFYYISTIHIVYLVYFVYFIFCVYCIKLIGSVLHLHGSLIVLQKSTQSIC